MEEISNLLNAIMLIFVYSVNGRLSLRSKLSKNKDVFFVPFVSFCSKMNFSKCP
jgi:hypothetical protein